MKEFIFKNIDRRRIVFFVIITSIVYLIMPIFTMPKVMQFSNNMNILDLMPDGYNFEYVNTLFNTLGEEGRRNYLIYQIPVDMIFPALLAISNILLIAFFLKKLNHFNTSFFYLIIIPLIAGIADYLENIGIITLLIKYPEITTIAVKIISIFSVTKYTSIIISFLTIIILMASDGVKYLKRNK